jgi:hypothetical protein
MELLLLSFSLSIFIFLIYSFDGVLDFEIYAPRISMQPTRSYPSHSLLFFPINARQTKPSWDSLKTTLL